MLPPDTFREQTVLITGGGTGLGLETARLFARHGARLVLASRDPAHLDPAARSLRDAGAEVLTVVTDVRRPREVARMLEAAVERFRAVDVLVNNAAGNFLCPTEDLSPGAWKVVIDIALNGVFFCTREVGRHMIERRAGKIVNVVAAYAWTGGPGTAHSAAAKAGVVALTRTLGVEWARHGIRVNAVCPGIFQSEGARIRLWPTPEAEERLRNAVPLGRFAEAEEVGRAILYLASPFADYINGEVLVIDGGAHLGKGLSVH
jgi:NAD(P)-dependent dehydrogenase (short-subunit alcohol dehydrogenase family)